MPRRAIFRCDASPEIGGGHLVRCRSLAEALRARGWSVGFAMAAPSQHAAKALRRSDFEVLDVASTEAGDPAAGISTVDLLVVDSYALDASAELRMRDVARQIMVVDDLADRQHDADILLDPAYGRRASDYSALVPSGCRMLVGSEYALVRPAFAALRDASLRRRAAGGGVVRTLVSCGLLDAQNVTSRMLAGLAAAGFRGPIDVVLGPAAPHRAVVAEQVTDSGLTGTLHLDPSNLPEIMAAADLALGTAGSSAWERCALGLPAICAIVARNQEGIAAALAAAGAQVDLGWYDSLDPSAVGRAAASLAADPARLAEMAAAAARICDGRGVHRTVGEIDPEIAAGGASVTLRPARWEDGELLFGWQTAPGVRRHFRNKEMPQRDEHFRWLRSTLDADGLILNIIACAGRDVGMLRLDRSADRPGTWEVSILVAPAEQRRGIGQAALRCARRLLPDAMLVAWIEPENVGSRAMFERVGFTEVSGLHSIAALGHGS